MRRCEIHLIRAQVEVIGGKIAGWAVGRAGGFGGLRRRFDDPGAGRGHLVLKVENVGERAVKPVGPEMRASISCALMRTRLPALRTGPGSYQEEPKVR